MLYVYITHDGKGAVLAVHASVEGAATHAYGHGNGRMANGSGFTLVGFIEAFQSGPRVVVDYPDGQLVLERHAVGV